MSNGAAIEADPGKIPAGTMIGATYRVAEAVGEGGMGIVYRAEHVLMRKEVAIKVLHAELSSEPEVVARFEREAIAAAQVDHPNVAGATDSGRLAGGACYLVLELLRGPTLREVLAGGALPLPRALHILRGVASGVGAAHAKGVIHRDLKPDNVMLVERDGDSDFVKVLDFGIAKIDRASAAARESAGKILTTRVGTIFGTPEYMAPEQAVGDPVDARADLYSLGVMFLEMLTGKCPFAGRPISILRERILSSGPPDMSTVDDPAARDLVTKLLTRFPDDRMQSASDLVAAIDAMAAIAVPIVTPTPPPTLPPRRRRWLLVPAAIAGAAAIVAGTFAGVRVLVRPKPVAAATAVDLVPPPADPTPAPPPLPSAPLPSAEPAAVSAAPAVSSAPPPPPPRAKPHPVRPAAKKTATPAGR